MSTNFYWKKPQPFFRKFKDTQEDSPQIHIGKRSAAGMYCTKCGNTLCADGTDFVHDNVSTWYSYCPCCGNKNVEPSTSFTWTIMAHKKLVNEYTNNDKCIVDEYGREYTAEEFLNAIDTPIQKQHYGYWS